MKPLKPLVHTREFWCETCGQKEPMTPEQFKEHLATQHYLSGRILGKETLRLALDMSAGQYSNTYDWILTGKVRVTEVKSGRRG